MNQVEIIKAILAGEALEVRHPNRKIWNSFNDEDTSIERSLECYVGNYESTYVYAEFRLAPNPSRYQTRAYLYGRRVHVWTSTYHSDQEAFAASFGDDFRWLEDTQTKEYV